MSSTRPSPPTGRRLVLIAVLAAVAGALLAFSFAYADHAPAPHGVAVGIVAPAPVAVHVAHGLAAAAPGAFAVVRETSPAAARMALRTQRIRGALVLNAEARARVLTAGAAGPSLAQVVATALSRAAAAAGHRPVVQDVVPPAASDRTGLSAFVIELALLIPSVLGSVGLYLVGLRVRLWWRVGAAALYSVLVALAATLVVHTGFGATGGSWWATGGIAALGALAFVLPVAGAQATFGLPGTGVMALVLIFLGNAVAGGGVPTGMLPNGYRQLSPWLPNGAIVHAVRATVYFGGHGIGQPLLTLALWAGAGLLVLLINDLIHLAVCRRAPQLAAVIFATPGVVHAARAIRERRRGSSSATAHA